MVDLRTHPRRFEAYDRWRGKGFSQAAAARKAGISTSTAGRYEKQERERKGYYGPGEGRIAIREKHLHASKAGRGGPNNYIPIDAARGAIPRENLRKEAAKALDDFAYFRRRYFGRLSTPWQEEAAYLVKAMAETKQKEFVVVNCPPGCLAGTTKITVNRAGNGVRRSIADVATMLHGGAAGGKQWDQSIPTYVSQAHGGVARKGRVADVWASGEQMTYTLTTTTGRSIRATANHPFGRPDGSYTRLDQLRPGDLVNVNVGQGRGGSAPRKRYDSVYTRFHPHQRKAKDGFRYWKHRLVMEAHLNGLSYEDYIDALRNDQVRCKEFAFLSRQDHVHHLDENHRNNELWNLAVMSSSAHHLHHAQPNHVLYQIGTEAVASVVEYGMEMTYDLAMVDEPHNFLANGFVVHNSGKSTLFALEIPAWLTCQRRGIRGMIGSASQTLAERYLLRLRNALENPWPARAESEEMEQGLAFDAEASLLADFGLFKPEGAVLWSAHAFIVSQLDERPITEKEPTWSAYGLDTAFIGGRFDVAIWDDATEDKYLSTPERIDKQRDRWDKVAEKRLEPGGLLVLQGQRLSPEDLYRHCLDKRAGTSSEMSHLTCCDARPGRKYHHIIYRAHYEDRCVEEHDPGDYYPTGCLLDPHRLSWHELEAEMQNNSSNFMQVYQQEDVDPEQTLVDSFWIQGGTHPVTKEIFPGCWDKERDFWQLPTLAPPYVSYMCVDPSPTRMWGITMWVYHPATQLRFLVGLHRSKLAIGQFFDWNEPDGSFKGVLADWHRKSIESGFPLCTLIFEANAAQRFFFATEALRRWSGLTGVRVIGHETHAKNKLDKELGPQILRNLYRRGLVRLPGGTDLARLTSSKLIEEVTRYPMARTDDLVMSQWFGEANLDHIYAREPKVRVTWRPSWLREGSVA